MNNQEAIDLLDNLIGMISDNQDSDYDEALKMAISALSENEGDLISRKSLLNKINAYVVGSQDKEFICKLIKEMPSVENKGEWIPVSEKNPGIGEHVLVCLKDGYIDTDDYYNYGFDDWKHLVVAWQPLPEPYKGVSK